MNNLVSIIIPTYKRSDKLSRAIESCLNQTYDNIEIIIIDDNEKGSSYQLNTEKKINKYINKKKIKYVQMPSNGGGAKARNYGIEHSQGKYIAFLDDDDYFMEEKIEKQLDFMKKNDLDASFTGSITFDETKNKVIKVKTYKNFNKYDNVLKFHLIEMIVSTQTFMYKKSVLEKIDGFTVVPAGQEYYLMYKTIINNYKVGYLDEALSTICIHQEERITTNKNKINAEKFLLDLKLKHKNILNDKEIAEIKYRYLYNIAKYYQSKSFSKYLFYVCKTVLLHPLISIRKVLKR